MKPVNSGGHPAYQNHVLTLMREYYPDPDALSSSTWTIIDQLWNLDLSRVDVQMADRYMRRHPKTTIPQLLGSTEYDEFKE